jgi:DNA-binding transcriptional MocR family regulator
MTISPSDIDSPGRPRYLAIADAIASKVAAGELSPGERLPTHRDLAWRIGVTIGTVTRAYAELERRGLTIGEVGRGTFVRGPRAEDVAPRATAEDEGIIDLRFNYPPQSPAGGDFADMLRRLADDPNVDALLRYQPHLGRPDHRAAAARWIAKSGLTAPENRIAITLGAQHGIVTALAATTRAGDRVGAETFTHPGFLGAARMLGLRLEPIAGDEQGLIPDAVAEACRAGVKAIYCIPTLQNPTATILPADRRQAIAEIVTRHGTMLIEDDLFAYFHVGAPPPITSLAPDHVIYVTSLSKTVASGLRIGYVVAPPRYLDGVLSAIRTTCWMATPLTAEIATRWIQDGTADRTLDRLRADAATRLEIGRRRLAGYDFSAADGSLHIWLRLPDFWDSGEFVNEARRGGVAVAPDAAFRVGRPDGTNAVRVCLGPPETHALLETGLVRLAALLQTAPPPRPAIV